MEAKKQLRKPENWETFESLCKKLWGEIWNCPEIKKNGRKGQKQNGVDIIGVPFGEKNYYGIQCKGKDEYSHKQLTTYEIDTEIENAKQFIPPLSKFYFVTTANKDAKIEQYTREKDLENRNKGLFEIHLFSWEDIVDLIDENKDTHDWYLKNQRYRNHSDIALTFENGETEFTAMVPFCKKYIHYKQRIIPASNVFSSIIQTPVFELNNDLFKGENKSYLRFKLLLKNTGNSPIENPQIAIEPIGEFENLENENFDAFSIPQEIKSDVNVNNSIWSIQISPHRNTLALDERYFTNYICIKPKLEGSVITLKWKFISNNFKKEGELELKIETKLLRKDIEKSVDYKTEERVTEELEDYYEDEE